MEAFRQFYIDHGERLFGYLLRKSGSSHLAADMVQETFARYWERYRQMELSVPLLFTIARNIFYDHIRQQRHTTTLDDRQEGAGPDQEQAYIVREEARQVLHALQQLDEDERDILALVVSSGLTYSAIAAMRGCSEANIKVKVHRARQRLRQFMPREQP